MRDLTENEQELYDELIDFTNKCLEDGDYTIECLIEKIDNLLIEVLKNMESMKNGSTNKLKKL